MLFSWYASGAHPPQTITTGFLAYNVIAFGAQPIIGYLCDANRKIPIDLIGCPLLAIGLLNMRAPAASIALLGLGNACFHIAGGIGSLRQSGGKMARSGVFVSSGALGVALGSLAGKSGTLHVLFPIGALLFCFVLLYVFCHRIGRMELNENADSSFAIAKPELGIGAVIALASVSIMIRAYAGSIIPTEWRTTTALFAFPAIGAFAGKASGGFIADRIGARKAIALSLSIAMAMLAFGHANPWIYLIGIALFNINMSVTLCAIATVLPTNPGLAFGITTLALLCGSLPTFFVTATPAPIIFAALTAASAACLYCILRKDSHIEQRKEMA